MKKLIAVLALGFVLVSGVAFADDEEHHGILGKLGDGIVAVWNLVPASIELVNGGLHIVCGKVHDGIHAVGEFLKVDNLP